MRNVIRIQTVAGPAQASNDVLAAALAELVGRMVDAEHRASEADLMHAVLVDLGDDEAPGGARTAAA